jgi:drug/metabolite transporter (DMT)-like permease
MTAAVSASRVAATTPLPSSPALALVLATFLWSGSFVVARALRDDIDPLTLTFLRWSISLVVLLPFMWRELAANAPALIGAWRLILGLSATGIALFHPLIFLALQHTSATNALLVLSLSPVAILIGAYFVGGQRPSARQAAGVLVSLAGAAILITRGDVTVLTAVGFNTGDLWMLAASVVWAIYSLLLRRRPAHLSQTVTLVSSIAAALPMLLPFLLLAPVTLTATWTMPMLAGVLYIALLGSVVGFRCWAYGVAKLGPSRAGQYVHLMPLFGAVLAFAFLGEPLTMPQIAGATLVLSGIVLIERQG